MGTEKKCSLVVNEELNDAIHSWMSLTPEVQMNWDGGRDALNDVAAPVLKGFGAVRIRLLDRIEDYRLEALERLLIVLSRNLGYVVPQSYKNNLVGIIQDENGDYSSPSTRGHKTNSSLSFHCDRTDLIMLLYVRPAQKDGRISIVSFKGAVYQMNKNRSLHLDTLFKDFPFDLRDEHIFNTQEWCMHPILWRSDGEVRGRYIRRFIEDSQRHPNCPPLLDNHISALNEFDAVLDSLRTRNTFAPATGELVMINNFRVLHAREGFSDCDREGKRRLAIRTWVAPFGSEALPKFLLPISGAITPGSYRGGIGKSEEYMGMLGETDIHHNEGII